MASVRNILFIMCDQLRADYLSCYGHPRLATPNIDRLAAMGTRFTRAYVQGSVCGPSRMSFYTGRYVMSHGATWNFVPLPAGERTLGDYLRAAGVRTAVVGKTHAASDVAGITRLSLNPETGAGLLLAEAGFEPYARHDGIVPDNALGKHGDVYNKYLKIKNYSGSNPWHDYANAGVAADGSIASGWNMRNAKLPARVDEADAETAWTTDRAMDFIREQGEQSWCLHLSYIKPHWPYIAPAPYHAAYGADDCNAPVRADHEREDAHPVYRAFRQHPEGVSFSRDEVRHTVIPAYMGLVKQIDDHIGRLLAFLEEAGRMGDTMIVFTSDHGDYLGDHWLGEKEMMFEQGVRVPLIIVDPADQAARNVVSDALVEAIDLVPTFLDALGQTIPDHILEGLTLLPLLRGGVAPTRDAVFCELDYAFYGARQALGLGADNARAVMVRTQRWKLIHYDGFPPQLFDMANDPHELHDQGAETSAAASNARRDLYDLLFVWMRQRRNRIAMSGAQVIQRNDRIAPGGVVIGRW
jgi:arylsulfatase A-like enzyme